jgi:hypothetical protein
MAIYLHIHNAITILPVSANSPEALTVISKVFMPMVILSPVPEIDLPANRWPHYFGQITYVTYKWDATLPPYSQWRYAFEQGISDWNATDTLISLVNSDTSLNVIKYQYFDPPLENSFTVWHIENGVVTHVTVIGNPYWDFQTGLTDEERQGDCAHEIGHLQLVGHIPESYLSDALMKPDAGVIYSPQYPDINLINQAYP